MTQLTTSVRIYIEREFEAERERLKALFVEATAEERVRIAQEYQKAEAALAQMKANIDAYNAVVDELKKKFLESDNILKRGIMQIVKGKGWVE